MSKYPHDRYDDVPEYTDQLGAHRAGFAKPESNTGLNVIIIAAALALAIGIASFLLLPQLRADWFGASGDNGEPQATATAQAESADDGADAAGQDDGADTGGDDLSSGPAMRGSSATLEPGEELSGGENPDPTGDAEIDYTQGVEVYNSTMAQGLAGEASQALSNAGFNVPVTANWDGFQVSTSAVFYADDEATAQAIADELGITAIQEPTMSSITVVLADDYGG